MGLQDPARRRLETRDYSKGDLASRMSSSGVGSGELVARRGELGGAWIPGVEVFARRVFQQKGRGYFAELARTSEGPLHDIGLAPRQWASALMHSDSAKGFHIHPPHVPNDRMPVEWFRYLYVENPLEFRLRPYDLEQWDIMFFLTGICEIILVDERQGLPRRVMRFTISGDSRPGVDNAALVIPAGVAHALRSIGNEDLIMTYGTSTIFKPEWEGRIASDVENPDLPPDWIAYLAVDSELLNPASLGASSSPTSQGSRSSGGGEAHSGSAAARFVVQPGRASEHSIRQ
jgi:dTDP-4-dehydrorhamnose 3,5-epimerase-like enzyme